MFQPQGPDPRHLGASAHAHETVRASPSPCTSSRSRAVTRHTPDSQRLTTRPDAPSLRWAVCPTPWGQSCHAEQPSSVSRAPAVSTAWSVAGQALPGCSEPWGPRTLSRLSVPRGATTPGTRWWWTARSTTSTCCPAASSTARPCPSSVSARLRHRLPGAGCAALALRVRAQAPLCGGMVSWASPAVGPSSRPPCGRLMWEPVLSLRGQAGGRDTHPAWALGGEGAGGSAELPDSPRMPSKPTGTYASERAVRGASVYVCQPVCVRRVCTQACKCSHLQMSSWDCVSVSARVRVCAHARAGLHGPGFLLRGRSPACGDTVLFLTLPEGPCSPQGPHASLCPQPRNTHTHLALPHLFLTTTPHIHQPRGSKT